jgi:hypothetical protein
MELDPSLWTLAEAETLFKNVKRTILEVTGIGKYTTEAQNFELQFNVPLPELAAAAENLLAIKRAEANGECYDPSFTKPFLF